MLKSLSRHVITHVDVTITERKAHRHDDTMETHTHRQEAHRQLTGLTLRQVNPIRQVVIRMPQRLSQRLSQHIRASLGVRAGCRFPKFVPH